jgi:adenine deaminase
MDRILRHAIAEVLAPMLAVQMATLNPAEHFGVSREVGMIAPGRWADILLVKDLKDFHAELVLVRGQQAAENGKLRIDLPKVEYPAWATQSIHLKHALSRNDFRLRTALKANQVSCNVIGIIENQAPTKLLKLAVSVKDGELQLPAGLAKLALVERHAKTGVIQLGLVRGFGLSEGCAIASTVAHDCHHMLVIGTSDEDMATAANKLAETGGGQVVVKNGKVIGLVELTIGGLMSTERADAVAKKANTILEGFRASGCIINNPNMTMSLLALPVIPELRLTDKGLVDVAQVKIRPVIEGPAA